MIEENVTLTSATTANTKKRLGLGLLFGIYTQIFEVFMLESIGGHHDMDPLTFGLHTAGDIIICFGVSKLKNLVNSKTVSIATLFAWGVIVNYALHLSAEDLYHNIAHFLGEHAHEGHEEIGSMLENGKLLFVIALKVIAEELSKYYVFQKNKESSSSVSTIDKLQ